MPTYEYRCEACDNTFDVVQGFADGPLTTCEACGGTLRKVFAPVGIVFKGSGFYKTDSRTSKSARSGSSATKEPASSEPTSKETPARADAPAPAAATAAKETSVRPDTASTSPSRGAKPPGD